MNAPSTQERAHVIEVVARCLDGRSGPSDAMASMPSLRRAPPQVRAHVAAWSHRVVGARRRLEFVLGDELPTASDERARVLTLAAMVEAGVPRGSWCAGLPTCAAMQSALDGIEDPTERLAMRGAAPLWVAQKFRQAFGDAAEDVLRALGEPPRRTLRCNLLRGSREDLLEVLAREGVEARRGELAATAAHCEGHEDLFATSAFRDGWFEQQDEASQLAIMATAPPPKGRVLDLCCGSGGKTLGLAAALRNRGTVMATDVHEGRLRAMRPRLARAGADNVLPHLLVPGDEAVARFASGCDRILIDAPCSGTGSWRRRPQARTAVGADGLRDLVGIQRDLLRRAAGWLKPGARLVYATCSLLPDENEQQIGWLVDGFPELEVVRLAEILGGSVAARIADATGTFLQVRPDTHGCDGFFLAVVRRPRRD